MARFHHTALVHILIVAAAFLAISLQHQSATAFAQSPLKSSTCRQTRETMTKSSNSDNDNQATTTADDKKFEVQTWNPLRLAVLRLGLTEPAMTSPLNYGKKDGTFRCAYCGQTLFDSNAKYDSGSGWPSFWRSIEEGAIDYKREFDGRLECRCGRCKSHLGHVFLDGPLPSKVDKDLLQQSPASDPRGRQENGYLPRVCINGASLRYDERQKS